MLLGVASLENPSIVTGHSVRQSDRRRIHEADCEMRSIGFPDDPFPMTARSHAKCFSRTALSRVSFAEGGAGRAYVRSAALCAVLAAGFWAAGCTQSVSSTWTQTAPPVEPQVRKTDASQLDPALRAGLSLGPIARTIKEE